MSSPLSSAQDVAAEPTAGSLRMGVSFASFGNVNRDDASAAIKAWAATVLKERGISVETRVDMFDDVAALRGSLARNELDVATMSAEEFVQGGATAEAVFLTAKSRVFTEEYVLLTHRASGLSDVASLKGRRLAVQEGSRTRLALPWLETLLARQNLGRAKGFFGEMAPSETPAKAVLRVFFRQADACVVTTNAFALACELNPQVRQRLTVVATSPAVVPTLMFFRPSYAGVVRDRVEAAIQDLHNTPAGLQVLTVFQGDQIVKQPLSQLNPTQRLLEEYWKLRDAQDPDPRPSGGGAVPSGGPP